MSDITKYPWVTFCPCMKPLNIKRSHSVHHFYFAALSWFNICSKAVGLHFPFSLQFSEWIALINFLCPRCRDTPCLKIQIMSPSRSSNLMSAYTTSTRHFFLFSISFVRNWRQLLQLHRISAKPEILSWPWTRSERFLEFPTNSSSLHALWSSFSSWGLH